MASYEGMPVSSRGTLFKIPNHYKKPKKPAYRGSSSIIIRLKNRENPVSYSSSGDFPDQGIPVLNIKTRGFFRAIPRNKPRAYVAYKSHP
jgi:hypothetical protein